MKSKYDVLRDRKVRITEHLRQAMYAEIERLCKAEGIGPKEIEALKLKVPESAF